MQAAEMGLASLREAATRVFSNSSGSYSSNVNLAVENSSWSDENQLQEMYLKRKSFSFNSDRPGAGGEESRDIFERAMKTVDVTFQNLDSSEISLTDVSHYFDSDPTKLVQSLRTDGKAPSAYIADTTTANAQVKIGKSPSCLRISRAMACMLQHCSQHTDNHVCSIVSYVPYAHCF